MGALLRRVHGDTEHRGQRPGRQAQLAARQQVLEALQGELADAIASEDFENAARLRDRIAQARRGDDEDGLRP